MATDRRLVSRALVAAIALGATGCVRGVLYTEITSPLTTNLRETPIGTRYVDADTKEFRYSLVDIAWDSNAIGDVARDHGLNQIYFADLHTVSVLFGIWTQQYVRLAGD